MPLRRRLANFWLRFTNWEYWPLTIANAPVVLMWLYFAIRSRRWFFFTTVNPAIDTGGVFGESKINILRRLPPQLIPFTLLVKVEDALPDILRDLKKYRLSYPLIAKPNIGERGTLVQKIDNETELVDYKRKHPIDFILQEYIDYPEEISVLHYRFPGAESGEILSLCLKEYLQVTGNGVSTIRSLMENYPRARLQLDRLEREKGEAFMNYVPDKDEIVPLEPIGNHCRGTMFLNGNDLIDQRLTEIFDWISQTLEHQIYYGRYDIKCSSLEDVKAGRNFKIVEVNGIAGEAAHIYDPTYPIWKKYRDIFRCWTVIFQISQVQRANGIQSMPLREGVRKLRRYLRHTERMKNEDIKM